MSHGEVCKVNQLWDSQLYWILMPSEFRRFGNLSFINQFSNIGWPQQPPQKGCLNSTWYFMILPKYIFFQNIKVKPNSRTWKWSFTTDDFSVIQVLQPQWSQQPHFIKKFTQSDGWSIPSTQMTNTSTFLWNGSPKIQIFHWYLISFLSDAV